MLHLLEGKWSTLFGILLHSRFVLSAPFIYPITYLYQNGLTSIYFILWLMIQYCYLFYCSDISSFGHWGLFQLVPASLPFDPQHCFGLWACLSISLFSSTIRCYRLILDISCPSPKPAIFLQKAWVPFSRQWLETKYLAVHSWIVSVLFWIPTSNEREFVLLWVFASNWYLSGFVFLFSYFNWYVVFCIFPTTNDVEHLFMFICRLHIFLGEVSAQIFCPFFNWVVFLLLIFKELFVYFG